MAITRGQVQALIECAENRWGEFPKLAAKYEKRKAGMTRIDGSADAFASAVEEITKENVNVRKAIVKLQKSQADLSKDSVKVHESLADVQKKLTKKA